MPCKGSQVFRRVTELFSLTIYCLQIPAKDMVNASRAKRIMEQKVIAIVVPVTLTVIIIIFTLLTMYLVRSCSSRNSTASTTQVDQLEGITIRRKWFTNIIIYRTMKQLVPPSLRAQK